MLRSFRPHALAAAIVCLATFPLLRAQSPGNSSLPLPEYYFPALKEILRNAVSQSPRMIIRNAENAVAEGNLVATRAGQLPSVNGWLSYYPYDRQIRADLPYATNSDKLSYNVSLNQPVYHWGALQNNTRISQLQLKMTQGQAAEGYRILVQEIRSQYLALVVKKAALARAQLGRRIAEDNFDVNQTKLEKKVISDADMFLPTIARDQARLAADRAEEDYNSSKSIFAKLCGTPVLSDDQVPDEIPDVSDRNPQLDPLLASYISQKDPNSFNLEFIGHQIEAEKLTYENISTRLRPQFNLVTGTSQDQQSYTTNLAAKYKVRDYFAGMQVSWSIFDGFAKNGAAASSLARRRELEQSYQDMAASLTDQARSFLKQVGFSRRAMEIANRLLNSSAGALREKKSDAARGLASDTDVNTFQLQFQETQLSTFAARSDYMLKVGDFLSTILKDPALANLPAQP